MAGELDQLTEAIKLAGQVIGGVMAIVVGYPMVRNKLKKENKTGSTLDAETHIVDSLDERVRKLEERLDAKAKKIEDLEQKLTAHAVRMTRLQMLVVKLEGLMVAAGLPIPEAVKEEMEELLKDVR